MRVIVDCDAAMGDVVVFDDGTHGLVTSLLSRGVEVAPLTRTRRGGCTSTGAARVPVPAASRTIDALGAPLDHGPALDDADAAAIFDRHPTTFAPAYRRFTFGALVHDLHNTPLGRSHLVYGPRELLFHIIRHQHACDRTIIIASPVKTAIPNHPALAPLFALPPHVHVTIGPDATEIASYLVPWSAMAIASALRARGKDVVVVIDSIDAWRFGVRAMPERGSWPTQLAQLASRAYQTKTGSVTLLAFTKDVTHALASGFDDAIDLGLHARGELARGSKFVAPPIRFRPPAGLARASMASARLAEFERNARFLEDLPRLDRATRSMLAEGRRARACLRFRPTSSLDTLEQMLATLVVMELEDLPEHAVGELVDAFLAVLRRDHASKLASIRAARELPQADAIAFIELGKALAIPFLPS